MSGPPVETGTLLERRPVSARGWSTVRHLARWLARHRVPPDVISIAGMLCGVAAGVSLRLTSVAASGARAAWVIGAVLILLRALANVLDGLVAVEFGRGGPLGELYNEVPDRVSDVAMLIGLGYAAGGNEALGYAAACAAVLVAYVRAVGKIAVGSQEYGGVMAKQQRMFFVAAIALYTGLAPRGGDRLASVGLAIV
jgi:phosphatidylglycerophosphate synthase